MAGAELAQQLGRPPRPWEVADYLGVQGEEVVEALASDGCVTEAKAAKACKDMAAVDKAIASKTTSLRNAEGV